MSRHRGSHLSLSALALLILLGVAGLGGCQSSALQQGGEEDGGAQFSAALEADEEQPEVEFGATQDADAGVDEPSDERPEAEACAVEGGACEATANCCDEMLCVPEADGGIEPVCRRVGCEPLGAGCTPGGDDCCRGTTCRATTGITFACQRELSTDPMHDGGDGGGPGDGGTGTCLANGAACGSPAVCCSMLCHDGACLLPRACQPLESACRTGADCCEGLQCEVTDAGASCRSGGCGVEAQGCTSDSSCCEGLRCLGDGGSACEGTTPCACGATRD